MLTPFVLNGAQHAEIQIRQQDWGLWGAYGVISNLAESIFW